ncbi:hypothetical protein L6164_032346 [Bauhinia variegata]|uniref:Uncharacterized protein n=1 Tax=Bauhinia variegata TaxID=167791 RepID=A0ACB9KNI5_BAUVA|nr:hypothetical protein L6164_032346 [Bauhinia variegata]
MKYTIIRESQCIEIEVESELSIGFVCFFCIDVILMLRLVGAAQVLRRSHLNFKGQSYGCGPWDKTRSSLLEDTVAFQYSYAGFVVLIQLLHVIFNQYLITRNGIDSF